MTAEHDGRFEELLPDVHLGVEAEENLATIGNTSNKRMKNTNIQKKAMDSEGFRLLCQTSVLAQLSCRHCGGKLGGDGMVKNTYRLRCKTCKSTCAASSFASVFIQHWESILAEEKGLTKYLAPVELPQQKKREKNKKILKKAKNTNTNEKKEEETQESIMLENKEPQDMWIERVDSENSDWAENVNNPPIPGHGYENLDAFDFVSFTEQKEMDFTEKTLEHMAESNPAIKYLLKQLKEKESELNSYKQAMDLKIAQQDMMLRSLAGLNDNLSQRMTKIEESLNKKEDIVHNEKPKPISFADIVIQNTPTTSPKKEKKKIPARSKMMDMTEAATRFFSGQSVKRNDLEFIYFKGFKKTQIRMVKKFFEDCAPKGSIRNLCWINHTILQVLLFAEEKASFEQKVLEKSSCVCVLEDTDLIPYIDGAISSSKYNAERISTGLYVCKRRLFEEVTRLEKIRSSLMDTNDQ